MTPEERALLVAQRLHETLEGVGAGVLED